MKGALKLEEGYRGKEESPVQPTQNHGHGSDKFASRSNGHGYTEKS